MAGTRAVVFDIGRSNIRAGYNHQTEAPRLTIPAQVGYPKQRAHVGMEGQDRYVGVDLLRHRGICDVHSPFGEGTIDRPDDLEALLRQGFTLLGANPEETPVVVTEPPDASRTYRHELGALLLRTFRVPSIMMVVQGVGAVFGCGSTSGLSVDVGEHFARSMAVVDGVGLLSTLAQTPVAAKCVAEHLGDALTRTHQGAAAGHVSQLMEAMCFVRDPENDAPVADLARLSSMDFTLPDGQTVTLGGPRFMAPEVLFDVTAHRDTVLGIKAPRVPDICRDSLLSCDALARDVAAPAIVCSGGVAMMKGFPERAEYALRQSFDLPPPLRASIQLHRSDVAPCDRAWVGSAVFSSMAASEGLFVTQADVSEEGLGALGRHRLLE
mmetsp:Transcript_36711/g.113164  ORF Transcript_36711/g.113164 Transcript_36711/m.113164 type:complete len:381 (-) Transcript_36711:3-1145(-)